jgi:ppGpp synthetase/RelA/SpoT-type nucleotidyltranferase
MGRLNAAARDFVEEYSKARGKYVVAARQLRTYVENALRDMPVAVHGVTARAKDVQSLLGKLRRKKYTQPKRELTDLIGIRVITYFARDIDAVAGEIRTHFDISERQSRDVRNELDENEFGYRSVHLVSRLRQREPLRESIPDVGRRWFEIQIRSILDHAWSEIEHETIYKSGISYSPDVRRKFMAIAGSLEVIDNAFAALRLERDILVDQYKREYEAGMGGGDEFDSARLFAFLESTRPNGLGWRLAEQHQSVIAPGLAPASLEALYMARLSRPEALRQVLKSMRFLRALEAFAADEGIAPESVSHLAVIVFAVACVAPSVLRLHFPEMLFSPSVSQTVAALS